MAMVRNTKLPLPKTNLLYYHNWTATEELIEMFLVIDMAVHRKGGLTCTSTKFMNLFRYILIKFYADGMKSNNYLWQIDLL